MLHRVVTMVKNKTKIPLKGKEKRKADRKWSDHFITIVLQIINICVGVTYLHQRDVSSCIVTPIQWNSGTNTLSNCGVKQLFDSVAHSTTCGLIKV